VQRLARVCPPRRQCRAVAVDIGEQAAENAGQLQVSSGKLQENSRFNRRDAEEAEIRFNIVAILAQKFWCDGSNIQTFTEHFIGFIWGQGYYERGMSGRVID
jgi:hypothetical protein